MEQVAITATMADGTRIEEVARDFAAFTGLVLAFRADPDCRAVTWRVAEPPVGEERPGSRGRAA